MYEEEEEEGGTKGGGRGMGGYTPVIKLSFISNACSLLASCHSLVRVFGGGSYKDKLVRCNTQTKGVTCTVMFKSVEQHTCNTDEGECANEDLEVVARLAGDTECNHTLLKNANFSIFTNKSL